MIKLPITPVAKPRMTRRDKWEQRPAVMRYWQFKDELCRLADEAGYTLGGSIFIEFHMPMPESWSKKKKARMYGTKHTPKPDLDNLDKSVLDSLAPHSDSHVWDKHTRKIWDYEGFISIENRKELP